MQMKKELLVITIIILIILAAISISLITKVVLTDKAEEKIKKAEELENKPLLEYEIIDAIDKKTCQILVRINSIDGIESVKYVDPKTDEEIELKANGKLTVAIDYKVADKVNYEFIIKVKGKEEKVENVYLDMDVWKKTKYPVLSNNRINNMEKLDQYGNVEEYRRFLCFGASTASDALPIAAWDGNHNTGVGAGTYYIEIADDMIGKTLVWNLYWVSMRTMNFTFCDVDKNGLEGGLWWTDYGGSRKIIDGTKYLRYYSTGHNLYEIWGQ